MVVACVPGRIGGEAALASVVDAVFGDFHERLFEGGKLWGELVEGDVLGECNITDLSSIEPGHGKGSIFFLGNGRPV